MRRVASLTTTTCLPPGPAGPAPPVRSSASSRLLSSNMKGSAYSRKTELTETNSFSAWHAYLNTPVRKISIVFGPHDRFTVSCLRGSASAASDSSSRSSTTSALAGPRKCTTLICPLRYVRKKQPRMASSASWAGNSCSSSSRSRRLASAGVRSVTTAPSSKSALCGWMRLASVDMNSSLRTSASSVGQSGLAGSIHATLPRAPKPR
mmetsp:Transcript_28369/g.85529  ORF Transcript_28369/g.85529 Transcript_28369/m.85529 type:complete len:207 (-) Transcript_28369:499-1119(-)